MKDEWYAPRDIRFTQGQMVWLVSWLTTLEVGDWPAIPQNETWSRRQKSQGGAYFEMPAQIWAEITYRLDRCGQDGEMLKDFYLWHKADREMCIAYRIDDIYEVERRVARALRYVSGWKRKTRSYQDFTSHPRHAKKQFEGEES